MNVQCSRCGQLLAVPPEKANVPGVNARCTGCGAVFALDLASLADASEAPQPALGAAPARAAEPIARSAPEAAVSPPAEKAHPPVPWRRCTNHPQARSESVCEGCGRGWCKECGKLAQNAVVCPACEALCVSSQKREEAEALAGRRGVPLFHEIEKIARYPLTDPTALLLLSITVGVLGVLSMFSGYALLVSQGLLMTCSFTALMRVSGGRLQGYRPDIRNVMDLVVPLRLGFAAFVASSWPLILLTILFPDARLRGSPPEGAEPTGAGVATLLALGYLWKLVYSPLALIVAGVSRSVLPTLNPLVGVGAILDMGPVGIQAMTIYAALALGQAILDFPLFFVPIAGGILSGFVDSYASLCVGCALGLAVFRKAPELGLE